jgi:hypothetical protein
MTQFTSIKQVHAHIDAEIAEWQRTLANLISGMSEKEIESQVMQAEQAAIDFTNGECEEFITSDKFEKGLAVSAARIQIKQLEEAKKSELMIIDYDLSRLPIPKGYNLISPAGFHHEVDNVFCLEAK